MPDCLIGLDLTLAIAQNVASSLVQLLPGVGSADMAITALRDQLAARIAELENASGTQDDVRPYSNNLPECSHDQLTAFVNNRALIPAKLRQTLVTTGSRLLFHQSLHKSASISMWYVPKVVRRYPGVRRPSRSPRLFGRSLATVLHGKRWS